MKEIIGIILAVAIGLIVIELFAAELERYPDEVTFLQQSPLTPAEHRSGEKNSSTPIWVISILFVLGVLATGFLLFFRFGPAKACYECAHYYCPKENDTTRTIGLFWPEDSCFEFSNEPRCALTGFLISHPDKRPLHCNTPTWTLGIRRWVR